MPHSATESSTTRPVSAPSHPITTPSQSSCASSSFHLRCSAGSDARSSERSSKSRCGVSVFAVGPRRRAVLGDLGLAGALSGGVPGWSPLTCPFVPFCRLAFSGLVASISLARLLRVSANSNSALCSRASARSARASAVLAAASASSVAIASLLMTSVAASSSSFTCARTSADTTLERSDWSAASSMSIVEIFARSTSASFSVARSLRSAALCLETSAASLPTHASSATIAHRSATTTVDGARGNTSSPPPIRLAEAGRSNPSRVLANVARFGTPTRVVLTASTYRFCISLARYSWLRYRRTDSSRAIVSASTDRACASASACFRSRHSCNSVSNLSEPDASHALARSAAYASACSNRARRSSTSASRSDLHLSLSALALESSRRARVASSPVDCHETAHPTRPAPAVYAASFFCAAMCAGLASAASAAAASCSGVSWAAARATCFWNATCSLQVFSAFRADLAMTARNRFVARSIRLASAAVAATRARHVRKASATPRDVAFAEEVSADLCTAFLAAPRAAAHRAHLCRARRQVRMKTRVRMDCSRTRRVLTFFMCRRHAERW